jgi:hypothetical protein
MRTSAEGEAGTVTDYKGTSEPWPTLFAAKGLKGHILDIIRALCCNLNSAAAISTGGYNWTTLALGAYFHDGTDL